MRTKFKKILAVSLSACILAGALSGCKKETATVVDDFEFKGYPVETDTTLTYWCELGTWVSSLSASMQDIPFSKALMEQTGINLKFIHPAAGQTREQFNLLIASDELPDIIEYNWKDFGPLKSLDEEYILPLNDLIESDSPNLKAYLENNPEVDKMVKTDDGRYYVYPFLRGDDSLLVNQGIIVRKDWLDDLGLSMPETMDEWHTVLTAFKEEKNATAPLSGVLNEMLNNGAFIGSYGVLKGFTVDDGKVVYGPYDPRYKEFLTTFAQWYKEGLIDPDISGVDSKIRSNNVLNGRTGVTFGFAGGGLGGYMKGIKELDPNAEFVGAPHVSGKKGEIAEVAQYDLNYLGPGSAAISVSCKNPKLAARLLDYAYGEEGHMLYNFGIEGESYEMIDGYPTYTDLIMKNPDGIAVSGAMAQYIRANYQGPFAQNPAYMEQYCELPQQSEALTTWAKSNMAEHKLPAIILTDEESEEASEILNNVSTLVSEKTIRYIMGAESLDTYDEFIKNMEEFGVQRLIEIYQQAYERYNDR